MPAYIIGDRDMEDAAARFRENEAAEKIVRQCRYLTLENQRLQSLVDKMTLRESYHDGVRDSINLVQNYFTISNMFEMFKRAMLSEMEKLTEDSDA